MKNGTLLLVFGLAITAASATSGYFAYGTSQVVLKNYYLGSDRAEQAQNSDYAADGSEDGVR
ncbi:hypothetical protein [Pseudomonas putida]|uniref:hypothetical protein n=1 Tax=Pseudomonas putida TaxID=303 RepID=UPI002366AD53|nr:hypothetical protein [Pseudomonas putida]MDD2046307.1 hypothetical protein [Pseudomonas putida]